MENVTVSSAQPRWLWRSRWAAIGAAIAVSIGGGGIFIANAAGGTPSSTVLTDPVRILDTRNPVDVGLRGPFVSPVPQTLQVTGPIPTTTGTRTVVPAGATGVMLNVTAVAATATGFISIRPGDATGAPATSSLNVTAGITVPNAVIVALPTAGADVGRIDITWDALGAAGPTTDILIDVVGYTTTLDSYTRAETDAAIAANTYTRAEIDQSAANTLKAAGSVSAAGTSGAFYTQIGTFTTARVSAGEYSISIPGLASACPEFPLVTLTGINNVATFKTGALACPSGNLTLTVNTRAPGTGMVADGAFNFQVHATARSPLGTGQLSTDTSTCTMHESGDVTCAPD